ncbi:IS3 family transposase, partial [Brevibacillus borstelensis]|nr:IS3 family transposase [Brevibacillus borstelensis]
CIYLDSFGTEEEVNKAIERYIHFYNHERIQARLRSLSPVQYRTEAA